MRRRRQERLARVVGVPGLWATAYGNIGSSIYYALGLVAAYALGLTPLVFIIAGLIFAATAITYTEGTAAFPEAGGSSSFARRAFNEGTAFGAAWAQMLNYIITIAISAFFVPHYLGVFWPPLRENPWDIIVGIGVVALIAVLNTVGIKEAAKLNIGLALLDLGTQILLVIVGFFVLFSPTTLWDNIVWGIAPTWSNVIIGVTLAMIAYTGIETVSNMAEEAKVPEETIPASIRATVLTVLVMYALIPAVALSALPVKLMPDGSYQTELGTTYAGDPILGIVDQFGISGAPLELLRGFVGILAATILIIATNAGVIGVSRLTYSMGMHRQLPRAMQRLHPRFNTPATAIVIFCAIAAVVMIPGKADFLSNLYAFAAMLSFSVAHIAIIWLRWKQPETRRPYVGRPNIPFRGRSIPLFAIFGLIGTGGAFVAVLVLRPDARWVGIVWMAVGLTMYILYRRHIGVPWRETVTLERESLTVEVDIAYTNILVPVVATESSEEMIATAGKLAADQDVRIQAITVVEVPMDLPLDAPMPREDRAAELLLAHAKAIAEEYGATVTTRVVRGRQAGRTIVEEATAVGAEVVMMGVARKRRLGEHIFGRTVDYVVKHADCRVVISSDRGITRGTSRTTLPAAATSALGVSDRARRNPPDA
ncbi:MAG: universal stress protein [Thermoleophilia bacterium]|nr:universal stress protein [Thermoleophilia bacterium]